jgi:hypothetical protein
MNLARETKWQTYDNKNCSQHKKNDFHVLLMRVSQNKKVA